MNGRWTAPPFRSRRIRWIAAGAGLLSLVFGGWLSLHLIPRENHFRERRGTVVHVEAGENVPHPGGFVSQTVRVTSSTGLKVSFRVLRPAAHTRPLPLLVLLGGHRTGRNAIDVLGNPGGIAVAALDYPYHGPERPRGVLQSLRTLPAAQRGILDTPPAVSVALDWLLSCDWVEPRVVELMGVSLGVPFASVAGALDGRFRRVWLVHGGAGNQEWLARRLERRIPNGPLRHLSAALLHLLAYGPSFRTESWVKRIAPRPVVVVGAREDEEMPPGSVEELFARAHEPKEILWSEGGHVRPERAPIVRELLQLVRARIKEPEIVGTH